MIEILLIIYAGRKVATLAAEKGLPKTWGLLALLIPVVGIGAGVVALILLTVTGLVPQDLVTLTAIPFYLGAEVACAFFVVNYMKKRPSTVVPAAVVTVAEPGEGLAGMCSECGKNKWLDADGGCAEGHPASCISNVYSAPRAS